MKARLLKKARRKARKWARIIKRPNGRIQYQYLHCRVGCDWIDCDKYLYDDHRWSWTRHYAQEIWNKRVKRIDF